MTPQELQGAAEKEYLSWEEKHESQGWREEVPYWTIGGMVMFSDAFLAGDAHGFRRAHDEASEGFGSWYNDNRLRLMIPDGEAAFGAKIFGNEALLEAYEAATLAAKKKYEADINHVKHFYLPRMERIKDYLKEAGHWNDTTAAIFANGKGSVTENPTYSQHISILESRCRALEKEAKEMYEWLHGDFSIRFTEDWWVKNYPLACALANKEKE